MQVVIFYEDKIMRVKSNIQRKVNINACKLLSLQQ